MSSESCSAAAASFTPSALAALLREHAPLHAGESHVTGPRNSLSSNELIRLAAAADERGDLISAADLHLDLLELTGDSDTYTKSATERLQKLYPMGDASRVSRNHSDTFRTAVEQSVAAGKAEVLSASPPVYLLHDVLSATEVADLRGVVARRRDLWGASHPLVCFQHDAFTGHPGLTHAFDWMRGRPGAGGRGCFAQAASRATYAHVPWSESLFVYRGQEALFDGISRRVQEMSGLHDTHAYSWQALTYEAGRDGGYADHTDCEHAADLLGRGERMATLLVYLTDDFDGGETEFPKLGLKVKPPVGSALLFYNFGPGWGGRACSAEAAHRSNRVTRGSKVVLQRWHSYQEQPFLAGRPILSQLGRRPFQPVVSCDYVSGLRTNVSCRWYNSDVPWTTA